VGVTRRALLGLTALSASLLACSQEPRPLTPAERELLRETGLGHPTVVASIAAVGGPVHRLMGLSDGGEAVPAPGVTVELREDRVSSELARLRAELGQLGFGVYQAEQNFGFEPDRLAIVSGADPYDFLRVRCRPSWPGAGSLSDERGGPDRWCGDGTHTVVDASLSHGVADGVGDGLRPDRVERLWSREPHPRGHAVWWIGSS